MQLLQEDKKAVENLQTYANQAGLDIVGGKICRTSSRFCLGVEHGDYNGTALFGVGTDRFTWIGYKPNKSGKFRLFSGNFPDDDVIEFEPGKAPEPQSEEVAETWGRFPYGVEYILSREGFDLSQGIDAVVWGNIPGGGMSRSASLALNLIEIFLEVNGQQVEDPMKVVNMAQAVENDYIGSPCGKLDQIMIYFAKEGKGTYYDPSQEDVEHIPFGGYSNSFRLVSLDTGTVRPGLEKSTYKIRRNECEELTDLINQKVFEISALGDIKDEKSYQRVVEDLGDEYPDMCDRLRYIFEAGQRFDKMLKAWRNGDIESVGEIFRQDGIGLRDLYKISGPELETMCDISRTVGGVLGERMLGGGDKGAAGAIAWAESVENLREAVKLGYPRSRPEYAEKFDVHSCRAVDGVKKMKGLI